MTRNFMRGAFAVCVALALAAPVLMIDVTSALAQSKSGTHEKSQRAKKPGETCENLKHDSKEYKDCVKASAQGTKPSGSQGKGKGK